MANIDENVKVVMLRGEKGAGVDELEKYLNARLADARYKPQAFQNSDAIQSAYPAGADGIFIASDTGHMWLFVNGKWVDAGIYQAAGVDATLSQDGVAADAKAVGNRLDCTFILPLSLLANGNNNVVTSQSGATSSYEGWYSYDPLNIQGAEKLYIKQVRGFNNPSGNITIYPVVFYDKDFKVVKAIPPLDLNGKDLGVGYDLKCSGYVEVPSEAVYVVFTYYLTNDDRGKMFAAVYADQNLNSDHWFRMFSNRVSLSLLANGNNNVVTSQSGATSSYEGWYSYDPLNIQGAEKLYIKQVRGFNNPSGNITIYPVVFYDKDFKVVKAIPPLDLNGKDLGVGYDLKCSGYVEVPSEAVYVVFTYYLTNDDRGKMFAVVYADQNLEVSFNPWAYKKVAFFGDSITDNVGTSRAYWQYLQDIRNIIPTKYGINGNDWNGVLSQLESAKSSNIDFDALFIFAGTNDYNESIPLGDWYTLSEEQVNKDGQTVTLKKRTLNYDNSTFRGRINTALNYAKDNFAKKQIILMTPLHRGYAAFDAGNVQPDEQYSNKQNLFISDYVNAVKEAGEIWSCPVIDLFGISGLLPSLASNDDYVHLKDTDRLHPGTLGHQRLAKVIDGQLNVIPPVLTIQ